MVRASILVAFRGSGHRLRVWDVIRTKLQNEIDAEIVEASDDGIDPFHKTLAINRAAERARGDVFAIWDADTWIAPETVHESIAFVAEHPDKWARPYRTKIKVSEEATNWVLAQEAWDGIIDRKRFRDVEAVTPYQHAPPLVLSRTAFETVGGCDTRFRGWSSEDLAFSHALTRLVGVQRSFDAVAWHLWHPRIGRSGHDLWEGQTDTDENVALAAQYRKAYSPAEMRRVIEGQWVSA